MRSEAKLGIANLKESECESSDCGVTDEEEEAVVVIGLSSEGVAKR